MDLHRSVAVLRFCQLVTVFILTTSSRALDQRLPLLASIAEVKELTPEQAALGYPVRLRAVVTFHNQHRDCFVMDSDDGVFVARKREQSLLEPGQWIDLEGVTSPGDYAPLVREERITILGRRELPEAIRTSFHQLASGQMDCRFVEVEGIVRVAFQVGSSHLQLHLAVDEGELRAYLYDFPKMDTARMVDSVVRLHGAVGGRFNQKRQMVAPLLFVQGTNSLVVAKAAPEEPFAAPVRSVRSLLHFNPQGAHGHRVKVLGVVTCQRAGQSLFLRDQGQGLYVQTRENLPLEPGDIVEALGFPVMDHYMPYLREAICRRVGSGPPPPPVQTTAAKILEGDNDADLVTIEAHLLDQIRRNDERVLVLQAGDLIFNAHVAEAKDDPALRALRNGSLLQLTGICRIHEVAERLSRFAPRSFQLWLRSPRDIAVLQRSSWWTPQRLLWMLLGMTVIFLAALGWVVMLKRRVAEQTEIIRGRLHREAALEERTRIARELHDTLEQELAGIALQLDAVDARWRESPELAGESLALARRMIRRSQAEARRSVLDLRSVALEKSDLPTALAEIASQAINGHRAELHTNVHGTVRPLPGLVENHLLRIGQEAVTNAIRHADCHQIRVDLAYEAETVRLRVQDDGRGFESGSVAAANGGHFGLLGMRERADRINARLKLQSSPGQGTEIIVEVPVGNAT